MAPTNGQNGSSSAGVSPPLGNGPSSRLARNGADPLPLAAAGLTDAMGQFQETMRQFLETQQRVMEAYLGQNNGSVPANGFHQPAPARLLPEPVNTAEKNLRAVKPVVEDHVPIPAPASPVVAPPPAMKANTPGSLSPAAVVEELASLADLLIGIAGERTGYPPEMLQLDANLEADLGIDSIKRVEIIGAFRRAALPALTEPPAWFMEEMTGAKNLQTILDGVQRLRDRTAPLVREHHGGSAPGLRQGPRVPAGHSGTR